MDFKTIYFSVNLLRTIKYKILYACISHINQDCFNTFKLVLKKLVLGKNIYCKECTRF